MLRAERLRHQILPQSIIETRLAFGVGRSRCSYSAFDVRCSPVTIAGISLSAVPERQNDYEHEDDHENEALLRIRRWMLGVGRWAFASH